MRPLAELPPELCRRVRYVLSDIDDTMTDDGRLGAEAYAALQALEKAGFKVIPVTGRPAGWCDMIARFWPVDAVVGENGAFWFRYDRQERRMHRHHVLSPAERARNRERLQKLQAKILAAVPGAAVAADQAYRETDLAIDFCEDVPALDRAAVQRIVQLFEAEGAHAKVSSIHVNGWFGEFDKLATARAMFRDHYGLDDAGIREQVVYVGDSPNDSPMFGFLPLSVGVANVRDFAGMMPAEPHYVTPSRGGAGFAELAALLIATSRASR
jgi:HAD superfamily hydrolase (TIGR01484 family)